MGGRCVRMPCHHGLRPDSDYVRPCSTMELPAAPPRARDSYNLSSALTALRLGRRMFSTGRHVLLQTSHAIVLAHMKLDNGLSGTTPCTETGYETGMEGLITSCREIQRASLHGQRVNKHDGLLTEECISSGPLFCCSLMPFGPSELTAQLSSSIGSFSEQRTCTSLDHSRYWLPLMRAPRKYF